MNIKTKYSDYLPWSTESNWERKNRTENARTLKCLTARPAVHPALYSEMCLGRATERVTVWSHSLWTVPATLGILESTSFLAPTYCPDVHKFVFLILLILSASAASWDSKFPEAHCPFLPVLYWFLTDCFKCSLALALQYLVNNSTISLSVAFMICKPPSFDHISGWQT